MIINLEITSKKKVLFHRGDARTFAANIPSVAFLQSISPSCCVVPTPQPMRRTNKSKSGNVLIVSSLLRALQLWTGFERLFFHSSFVLSSTDLQRPFHAPVNFGGPTRPPGNYFAPPSCTTEDERKTVEQTPNDVRSTFLCFQQVWAAEAPGSTEV